jgi:hypothetical protein
VCDVDGAPALEITSGDGGVIREFEEMLGREVPNRPREGDLRLRRDKNKSDGGLGVMERAPTFLRLNLMIVTM